MKSAFCFFCLLPLLLAADEKKKDRDEKKAEVASTLTLPAPQTIVYRAGKLVTITATTDAKDVGWEVIPVGMGDLDFTARGSVLILAMPPVGAVVYVVAAAVGADGKLALAQTSITVKGTLPKPSKEKGKGQVYQVTILYDSGKDTAAARALRSSATLAKGLKERGIKLAFADVKVKQVATLYGKFVKAAGGTPVLMLQDARGFVVPEGQVFRLDLVKSLKDNVVSVLEQVDDPGAGEK